MLEREADWLELPHGQGSWDLQDVTVTSRSSKYNLLSSGRCVETLGNAWKRLETTAACGGGGCCFRALSCCCLCCVTCLPACLPACHPVHPRCPDGMFPPCPCPLSVFFLHTPPFACLSPLLPWLLPAPTACFLPAPAPSPSSSYTRPHSRVCLPSCRGCLRSTAREKQRLALVRDFIGEAVREFMGKVSHKALPLPCVSTVFLSKTVPFLAV
eukprot:SAG22_NODE_723_length_7636_cov_75.271726_3_plen_213_part_00